MYVTAGPDESGPAWPAEHPGSSAVSPMSGTDFALRFTSMADSVERVIRGKREVVERALTCLLAGGHLLVEDVPGVGKTTLARCLAAVIGGRLQRVQFTPDLLPSDVVGVSIFHPGERVFQFHPGPVFANIVLGDEINRASPKTQSALLEVMEEHTVTVDGVSRPVPRPFMVIATQNPIELAGTYPLPEAQLDRFLMRVAVGYPDHAAEVAVVRGASSESLLETLSWPETSAADVAAMTAYAAGIHVADALYDYAVHLVSATRSRPELRLGASARASLALVRTARIRAAVRGRQYVVPDDFKALAEPVLAHRLVLTPEAEQSERTVGDIVESVLSSVPVPRTAAPVGV
nr:MoxR family ATPase [Catenulispora rubra]